MKTRRMAGGLRRARPPKLVRKVYEGLYVVVLRGEICKRGKRTRELKARSDRPPTTGDPHRQAIGLALV